MSTPVPTAPVPAYPSPAPVSSAPIPSQQPLRLMAHQQMIHDFIVANPFVGVWLGVGAGKTSTVLRSLQTIRPMGHILVIAPINIARSTWIDEIEKWGMPIRTRSLIVNERDKKLTKEKRLQRYAEVFTDAPTMYFINQDLVADLVANMPVGEINGRTTITWPFSTVIIDESQGFKSHSSSRFEALKVVRPAITRLIELTGTPAPNGLHDLWSQVYLLDQGQALGKNITEYRNRWFTAKTNSMGVPIKWVERPGAEAEIHQAIKHLVMSAQNINLPLPALSIEDVSVSLPSDLMSAYNEFKNELVLDVVTTTIEQAKAALAADPDSPAVPTVTQVIAQNQGVLLSKLMQFASGTLYTGSEEEGTAGEYTVIHEAKLEMVEYLVRNNAHSPVLLAYHFRSDREQILARLRRAGVAAEVFDGARETVRRWNNRQIPVLLIHPASAGHGLNLQAGGSTLIWYTLTHNLEHYLQANGRLYRTGQTDPVTIYRLITKGTQDARMPGVLATKEQTQTELLNAVDGTAGMGQPALNSPTVDPTLSALLEEVYDDLADYLTRNTP